MNSLLIRVGCFRGTICCPIQERLKAVVTAALLEKRKHDVSIKSTGHQRWFHMSESCCRKQTPSKTIKPKVKSKEKKETIEISKTTTVAELSEAMNKTTDDVLSKLVNIKVDGQLGKFNKDTVLPLDTIEALVRMHGLVYKFKDKTIPKDSSEAIRDIIQQLPADPSVLVKRPPVVTIMGHVDHGKTTLLDALRHSRVVDQEFGGITQHIGAFVVSLPSGEQITFLDTPGHAAFSAMRARGARITDIIVLVVAADDSVMQQTIESIEHAQRENVPIVVAINKVDKHTCDIENVKRELSMHGVMVEDMGGDVQAVPISALKCDNLTALQEAIATQSELMELKGDPAGMVEGSVIESCKDIGRGNLATIIVQRGKLMKGDILVADTAWAKVRGMFSDDGKPIQTATLSKPVQIIGWRDLPSAGDDILQVATEQEARLVVKHRIEKKKQEQAETDQVAINKKREAHEEDYQIKREAMWARGHTRMRSRYRDKKKEVIINHEGPELCIILKADVDGSLDAILDVLDTYNSDQCRLTLLHYGVGDIAGSDVDLAEMFDGVIFGFNVKSPSDVLTKCQSKDVSVRMHNVIYKMFDELGSLLTEKLPPLEKEEISGEAEILQIFSFKEKRDTVLIAGCKCVKGVINKDLPVRLIRKETILYDGMLKSLRHMKTEVKTIKKDVECGMCLDDSTIEFRPGDSIESYRMVEVPQTLDWKMGF